MLEIVSFFTNHTEFQNQEKSVITVLKMQHCVLLENQMIPSPNH